MTLSKTTTKLSLCLSLLFACATLHAQSIYNGDYLPPDPQAWGFIKYGGQTPDLYTGTNRVEIPIYTYRDPDFEIPVSLTYASAGYMPNITANYVGLGWTLSCGGMISRRVRGIKDEGEDITSFSGGTTVVSGYYKYTKTSHSSDGEPLDRAMNLTGVGPCYLKNNSLYETESDIYMFNFLGHSGKFVISDDGTAVVYDTNHPSGEYSINLSDFQRIRLKSIIVIRTGDGYSYEFGGHPQADSLTNNYIDFEKWGDSGDAPSRDYYSDEWYLTKITAPNGRTVELNYKIDNETLVESIRPSGEHVSYSAINPYQATTGTYTSSYRLLDRKHAVLLSSVVIDGCTLSFSYTSRSPEKGWKVVAQTSELATPPCLSSITVSHTQVISSLCHATLSYRYAPSSGNPVMMLSSVTIDGTGTYSLNYCDENSSFPCQGLTCMDHWGFYNSNEYKQPEKILPSVEVGSDYTETVTSTNRDPEWDKARYGLLSTITYPTGGWTEFEYEPNTYSWKVERKCFHFGTVPASLYPLYEEGGGMRVSRIIDYESQTYWTDRSYSYNDSERSSGIMLKFPRYSFNYFSHLNGQALNYSYRINSGNPGYMLDEPVVAYSIVKETYRDGSSKTFKFSNYRSHPDELVLAGSYLYQVGGITNPRVISPMDAYQLFRTPQSMSTARGKPLATETRDLGGVLKKSIRNTYNTNGVKARHIESLALSIDSVYLNLHYTGDCLLSKTTETDYTAEGDSISRVTEFEYNSRNQEKIRKICNSDGVTHYYHTVHIGDGVGSLTYAETSLRSRGIVDKPIYKAEYIYSGSRIKLLSATHFVYALMNTHGSVTFPLLSKEEEAYLDIATLASISGITSLNYRPLFEITSYNQFHRPCAFKDANGIPTVLLWGFGGLYPALEAVNSTGTALGALVESNDISQTILGWNGIDSYSERLFRRQPSISITTWKYRPLVGVTEKTGPNGRKTTYAYDAYGRLTSITGPDSKRISAYSYSIGGTDGNWISTDTYTTTDGQNYLRDVAYYDGLGLPEQTVQVAASPNGKSIITPVYKDSLLRTEAREYLPYEASYSGSQKQSAPFDETRFTAQYGTTDDAYAWSRNTYDSFAEGRITKRMKPGAVYRSEGRESSREYGINTGSDIVLRLFQQGVAWGVSVYPARSLYKTVSMDEDGRLTAVFTDKLGREVLSRQYLNSSGTTYADTYTIYDKYGRIIYVISPEGSSLLAPSTPVSDAMIAPYSSSYYYDGYGRMTQKRLAGQGWEYYVYDKGGRTVLRQDALMRQSGIWMYTVYDNDGREIEKSIVASSMTRNAIQNKYDIASFDNTYPTLGGSTDYRVPLTSGFSLVSHLSSTRYGGWHYRTSTSGSATAKFTVPSALAMTNVSGVVTVYERDTTVSNLKVYEKVYTLGQKMTTNDYAERAFHYDKKARVIQTVERNVLGGISRTSVKYNFIGNPIKVREAVRTSSTDTSDDVKMSTYTYDTRGRLLSESCTLNDGTAGSVSYTYDGIGRPVSRTLGNGIVENFTHTTQGWLSSTTATKANQVLFSQTLRYHDAESGHKRFSGDVGQELWFNSSDTKRSFSYDALGRITASVTDSSPALDETGIVYDLNGNLKSMRRYGSASSSWQNLYFVNTGNQLATLGVMNYDAGTSTTATGSYTYDAAGNMSRDGRLGVDISWNPIGLPETARDTSAAATVKSYFQYLADGAKVAVGVPTSGPTTYAGDLYIGSLIYSRYATSYTLQDTDFGGGRISANGPQYFTLDHLGNVRMVTDNDGNVIERNDYYTFGTRMPSGTTLSGNRYRYAGKEIQDLGSLGWLDFGARMYDSFIARWTAPDPLAEKYPAISPYAYCNDNPMNLVDRDGKFPETIWDVVNVSMDIQSLASNIKEGKVGSAIVDGIATAIDVAAAAIPFVPGGAGAALKAARTADKAADAVKTATKVSDVSKAVHGNSKASTRAQHAYDIYDKITGKIVKTGVSGTPLKNARSTRAQKQINKWNREAGTDRFEQIITHTEPEGSGARDRILQYEIEHANELYEFGALQRSKYHQKP